MSPRRIVVVLVASGLLVAGIFGFRLNRQVNRALESEVSAEKPVEFVPVPERSPLPFWGSEDVEAFVDTPGGIYAAGASGVARLDSPSDRTSRSIGRFDVSMALPTRRASALSSWRTHIAAGLDFGGLFVYRDGAWSEVRSGFGALHVRDLAENAAGELFIGAREGLFRMGLAERSMVRLHKSPVRSLVVGNGDGDGNGGRVISGGEQGLFTTQGSVTTALTIEGSPTAWVDDVAIFDRRIFAVTPAGLFGQSADGVLRSIPGGQATAFIEAVDDHLFATSDPPDSSLRQFDAALRIQVESLPSPVRRIFVANGRLVADTRAGLFGRSLGEWHIILKRHQQQSFGHAHVGALGVYRDRLFAGFFDGGLAELMSETAGGGEPSPNFATRDEVESPMALRAVVDPSAPSVWAVNALLSAGGALHIASLRGAFRFDGTRFTPVEGAGAAFSLAQTRSGVAIGYGEGVLLPENKLLSGFHGLPGNQATALAAAENGLLVGTPSGLGFVEDRTVRWRVASGEGKLPHPWVTAILPLEGSVLIGTYGGGLTRRKGAMSEKGDWQPFVETEGLKINTGCLVKASGRVYAGTDGAGLYRLSVDGSRFERLKLSLPSQRITALVEKDGFLYIGTDEGLTRWSLDQHTER